MTEYGLEEKELEEFNAVISGVLIPELIRIADKYNYNRDSMVKFAADTLTAMSELATFERYKTESDRQRIFDYLNGVADGLNESRNDIDDVLDKIRTEIAFKSRIVLKNTPNDDWAVKWNECIKEVLEVIDKYKS